MVLHPRLLNQLSKLVQLLILTHYKMNILKIYSIRSICSSLKLNTYILSYFHFSIIDFSAHFPYIIFLIKIFSLTRRFSIISFFLVYEGSGSQICEHSSGVCRRCRTHAQEIEGLLFLHYLFSKVILDFLVRIVLVLCSQRMDIKQEL